MYFPELKRRDVIEYQNRNNQFYADYSLNYSKVAQDCKERCVYCDITIDEFGGDKMQLDHFRPKKHFGHLEIHPYNLYLSCPKCNVLKTSDWPCDKRDGAPSFVGPIGYIDRFTHNAREYLEVSKTGEIISLGGPVSYMIKKMHLNRASRVNVRRKRQLEARKTAVLEKIKSVTTDLNRSLSEQEKLRKKELVLSLLAIYTSI